MKWYIFLDNCEISMAIDFPGALVYGSKVILKDLFWYKAELIIGRREQWPGQGQLVDKILSDAQKTRWNFGIVCDIKVGQKLWPSAHYFWVRLANM